jgi:hypothetical protein
MSKHSDDCETCKRNSDRSQWGAGPWDNEPENRIEFEHAGLPCILHRGCGGAWCGYVGLSTSHPAHGKDYDDVNVEVHGGLTYGEACQGHICHVPKPGEPEDLHWFGFDCNHAWDIAPGMARHFSMSPEMMDMVYRDVNYAKAETMRLAEQLAAMA